MLSVESLHAEAYDLTLELRKNVLGLRILYKLQSNTTYKESLNIMDAGENKTYEENEGATKQTGVYLRKLD